MAWFKVDDKLWGHPKWLALPPRARGLWVTAGSWCAAMGTDGFVPRHVVRALSGTRPDAVALVQVGLWVETDGGWTFHDWAVFQPDSASEKARREAESKGGDLGNHRRWHVKRKITVPGCEFCEASGTRSGADRGADSPPNPPVPTRPIEELSSEVADATLRPEIAHLLDFLDKHIEANGSKKPQRTKRNVDAARLLLDKDGRTVEQVEAAITWCQNDDFWRGVVLSMAKLREKYDQLRLAAQRQTKTSATGDRAGDILRATEQRYATQPLPLPQIGA